jgi:hypothetical protein
MSDKTKSVLCRVTEEEHQRWKEAAEKSGLSLNEYQRKIMNAATSELLDCQHPWEFRKRFPWSETCMQCGQRLKG